MSKNTPDIITILTILYENGSLSKEEYETAIQLAQHKHKS